MHKRALQMLFAFILVSLTAFNLWVSTRQPVWEWGGLTTPPDNLWTIATLIDAYYGFVTFYAWVLWKEVRALPRVLVVHRHHASRQHRDVGLRAAPARAPGTGGLHGRAALGAQRLTRMREFLQRRLVAPLLVLLRQGVTPRELALCLALGITIGLIPVLGVSTALCAVVALSAAS